jgi:hypothetical protein
VSPARSATNVSSGPEAGPPAPRMPPCSRASSWWRRRRRKQPPRDRSSWSRATLIPDVKSQRALFRASPQQSRGQGPPSLIMKSLYGSPVLDTNSHTSTRGHLRRTCRFSSKSSPGSREAQAPGVAILDNESPTTGGGRDETNAEANRYEAGPALTADHDGRVAGRATQARCRACVAQVEDAHRACAG